MIFDMPRTTILFRGGQYGMYLQWILYTLLVDQPIKAPFLRSKNSPKTESTSHNMSYINPDHIKQGILIPDYNDVNIHASARQLRSKNLKLSTMIYWGWNDPFLEDEYIVFANQIKLVSEIVDRVIIPYVDHSTYLLSVHNLLYKTITMEYTKMVLLNILHLKIYILDGMLTQKLRFLILTDGY